MNRSDFYTIPFGFKRVLPILVVSILLIIASPRANSQTLSTCAAANGTQQGIDLCTKLIQAGTLSGHDLAAAYNSRGSAHMAVGEFGLAIADYTQAIQIDPRYVEAFVNRSLAYNQTAQYDFAVSDSESALRINPDFSLAYFSRGAAYNELGKYDLAISDFQRILDGNPNNRLVLQSRAAAYFGKGQYDLAIADYNQVIQMNPTDALLYDARGRVLFVTGNYAGAVRDFGSAVSYDRSNPYSVLWLYLARSRSGAPQMPEFVTNSALLDPSKWPMPIVRLYLGKTSPAAVLAAASSVGQRCEANFYAAEWNILAHRTPQARGGLQTARQICPHDYNEYVTAQAEIARLP